MISGVLWAGSGLQAELGLESAKRDMPALHTSTAHSGLHFSCFWAQPGLSVADEVISSGPNSVEVEGEVWDIKRVSRRAERFLEPVRSW